jgi:hypothetical protein
MQPLIQSVDVAGGYLDLNWVSIPGRYYGIQSSPTLVSPTWSDSGLGPINADGAQTSASVPLAPGGNQAFYRVYLLPE